MPLALSKPPQYKGLPSPGKDLNGPYDNQRHGTTDPGVHPQVAQRKSGKSLSRFPDPGHTPGGTTKERSTTLNDPGPWGTPPGGTTTE